MLPEIPERQFPKRGTTVGGKMTPAMADAEARRLQQESDYVQRLRIRCRALVHEAQSIQQQYEEAVVQMGSERAREVHAIFVPALTELNKLLEEIEQEVREREVVQWESEMALAKRVNVKRRAQPRDFTIEFLLLCVLATSLWFLYHWLLN